MIIKEESKIDQILNRGVVVGVLPSIDEFRNRLMSGEKLRFYIGADPTSTALHLSHAKNYMLLEEFRKLGHEVIVLIGDFTARIGDPTDKSTARKQLTRAEVVANVKSWLTQIKPLMDFEAEENPPLIKYNNDWLSKLTMENVIDLASHFTVQRMLERDMFEKRMQEQKPIFLHEFMYPLMQGYDSVAMEVDVEMCGTDQTFNALAGRTLLRKMKDKEKFVLIVNLMENPVTKELMSKSRGTGVFLDKSPSDMYGGIMAQPDEMIEILLINNTRLPLSEVKTIKEMVNQRDAKMITAFQITKIFHGENEAQKSQDYFINTFSKKEIPDVVPGIKPSSFDIVTVLIEAGFCTSKTDARKQIEQKAVKIGEEVITDTDFVVKENEVVQKGKRFFVRVLG